MTSSCTDALEISANLLGVKTGDEVIVPSFTFVSTANAFFLFGASPIFCDIRSDTFNIDENHLEKLITNNTKAIVPVHYNGIACNMDEINRIADRYAIPVVEDNAHGLFGRYKGRYLGTFGKLATLSFDRAKNFTCGEGGAIIINDFNLIDRAEIIRDKGTNRLSFLRGHINKYSWVDVGSNHFPSELQAAFLYAQLKSKEEIRKRRQNIWQFYNQELEIWAMKNSVILPCVPEYCEQSFHQYHMIMPSLRSRDALIEQLANENITGAFHYVPLHLSEIGRRFGAKPGDCPIAEEISGRMIRLPFFTNLEKDDLKRITDSIKKFIL
jgi:dTDP-4-amino-4,6-dideoxygalactose transaminase